jgi:hypothetical protein
MPFASDGSAGSLVLYDEECSAVAAWVFSAALRQGEPDALLKGGDRPIEANETGHRDFGHFCAEVPKSLHIGAYPRVLLIAGRLPRRCETPANMRYSLPAGPGDGPNCHAEGRGFESHQPLRFESPALGPLGPRRGKKQKQNNTLTCSLRRN